MVRAGAETAEAETCRRSDYGGTYSGTGWQGKWFYGVRGAAVAAERGGCAAVVYDGGEDQVLDFLAGRSQRKL
ncbi:hypothetical protein Hanom_Chr07g00627361 [Helianthus anomalus]